MKDGQKSRGGIFFWLGELYRCGDLVQEIDKKSNEKTADVNRQEFIEESLDRLDDTEKKDSESFVSKFWKKEEGWGQETLGKSFGWKERRDWSGVAFESHSVIFTGLVHVLLCIKKNHGNITCNVYPGNPWKRTWKGMRRRIEDEQSEYGQGEEMEVTAPEDMEPRFNLSIDDFNVESPADQNASQADEQILAEPMEL